MPGEIILTGINNNGTFEGVALGRGQFLSNANGPPVTINTLALNGGITGVNVHGEVAGGWVDAKGVHALIIESGVSKTIKFPGVTYTAITAIDDWGNVAFFLAWAEHSHISETTIMPADQWTDTPGSPMKMT